YHRGSSAGKDLQQAAVLDAGPDHLDRGGLLDDLINHRVRSVGPTRTVTSRELQQRLPGDSAEDRPGQRWGAQDGSSRAVPDEHDVHGVEFLDPTVLGGVEPHDLVVTCLTCPAMSCETGRVVA